MNFHQWNLSRWSISAKKDIKRKLISHCANFFASMIFSQTSNAILLLCWNVACNFTTLLQKPWETIKPVSNKLFREMASRTQLTQTNNKKELLSKELTYYLWTSLTSAKKLSARASARAHPLTFREVESVFGRSSSARERAWSKCIVVIFAKTRARER